MLAIARLAETIGSPSDMTVLVQLRSAVGVGVDPVSLIVAAIAAGAAIGLKNTASAAVSEAYENVRALVRKRLAGRRDGELILGHHEQAPEAWEGPLVAELTAAGAGDDPDLVAAAQALMRLADESGYQTGKYCVDARGSHGVQIGDHNTQHNVFGSHARTGEGDGAAVEQ